MTPQNSRSLTNVNETSKNSNQIESLNKRELTNFDREQNLAKLYEQARVNNSTPIDNSIKDSDLTFKDLYISKDLSKDQNNQVKKDFSTLTSRNASLVSLPKPKSTLEQSNIEPSKEIERKKSTMFPTLKGKLNEDPPSISSDKRDEESNKSGNDFNSNLFRLYLEQKNPNHPNLNSSYLKQYLGRISRKSTPNQTQPRDEANETPKEINTSNTSFVSTTLVNSPTKEDDDANIKFNQKFFPYKPRLKPKWIPVHY
jgi:hypothetical protein